MAVFDQYIVAVNQYIDHLKGKGRPVRGFADLNPCDDFLFANDRAGSGAKIVLRSDTFLELGSPASGSCAICLYSDHPELIQDGRITLIGPDINESPSGQLPFGQVIIVGGEDLDDDDYYALNLLNGSELIAGYMIKSTPENIWCRISNDTAQKGFNFKALGSVLMKHFKTEEYKVQSAEVLFVTSSKEDVMALHQIGEPVRDLTRNIKEKLWKDRGVDIFDCVPGVHCGACSDKAVCDEIRKMAAEHRESPDHFNKRS